MRSEKWDITTNLTEIKRIKRIYYKKLYAKTLDNLDVTVKLQERHKLPNLTQEETKKNLNRCIASKETELVIKNF